MFDLKSSLNFTRTAPLTVGNNTQNAALIDMKGWASLTVLGSTRTITAAGSGITFKLQHSNSTVAGTFEDCTAAEVDGTITPVTLDTQDDVDLGTIGYRGNRRYVRFVAVGSASANGVVIGMYVRGRATNSSPVASIGTTTAAT